MNNARRRDIVEYMSVNKRTMQKERLKKSMGNNWMYAEEIAVREYVQLAGGNGQIASCKWLHDLLHDY